MKLAAMQPYFLPYLGQFDLLNQADLWVFFDVAQYIRHGWVNRNRVLHPVAGWQYITVPLTKHSHQRQIHQIRIANQIDWQSRIFKQIEHYHMDAPYYAEVIAFLENYLWNTQDSLSNLNIMLFSAISRYLGIETPIRVFSEMDIPLNGMKGAENLAVFLCQVVDADEYINPPGGVALYSAEKFSAQGIHLTIQSFQPMHYECGRYQFEPNLSILDVMMWNSPVEIKQYLDTF